MLPLLLLAALPQWVYLSLIGIVMALIYSYTEGAKNPSRYFRWFRTALWFVLLGFFVFVLIRFS